MVIGAIQAPLFVPANRPDRFTKAATSGADAVILDLEDAVAIDDKSTARAAITAGFTDLPVLLRINPSGTDWHEADLAAARSGAFAAVILPKAESPERVEATARSLAGTPLIAIIESAQGMANARKIAAAGVARLAFGSVDFCADLGCEHLREALVTPRYELVIASRLAAIPAPLDGVTLQLDDPDAAYDDACHARAIGMSGKLCIHPRQIEGVKRAFRPTDEQVIWARRVLASNDGAAAVAGEMVDEAVKIRARSILKSATSSGAA